MSGPQGSTDPIVLGGSAAEGGGQQLRSALTLSLITGRAFRLEHILDGQSPAGLRPSHLAYIRGAERISGSSSEGAEVGSPSLLFRPGPVHPGPYLLEVGTAGSATLLLQCLFYPLALAGGGQLTLRGGTHLPHSPSYHYLAWIWMPAIRAFGFGVELHLHRAGFYPQGAGEFRAEVAAPGPPPTRVMLPARGTLDEVEVASFVGGLPLEVAERQASAAVAALREQGIYCNVENLPLPIAASKGSAVLIRASFEHTAAGFSAVGESGAPAERVGKEAALELASFMESAGALDRHLAEQILLPAALVASGRLGECAPGITQFTAPEITPHLSSQAETLEKFLPVKVAVRGVEVEVSPAKAGE